LFVESFENNDDRKMKRVEQERSRTTTKKKKLSDLSSKFQNEKVISFLLQVWRFENAFRAVGVNRGR